ncbi:MAG: hypothetical protein N4A45_00155 [Flavobacteriales bacterium]|jgi:chromosome segregation ATPase|nr:hypothetical protein [Flavobacteriales bacterium]
MKKTFITVCALLFVGQISAQVNIQTDSLVMRKGKHAAFVLTIEDAQYKKTKTSWVKELTSRKKVKAAVNNTDVEVLDGKITDLINNELNIYSRVLDRGGKVIIESFYEIDNKFTPLADSLNNHTMMIRQFLMNYGAKAFNVAMDDQIEDTEDDLKGILKDIKKNQNRISKYESNIEKNLKKNKSMTEANLKTDSDIITNDESINNQRALIQTLSSGTDARKSAEKQLRKMEKSAKKLVRSKEKNLDRIADNEKDNVELKTNIERSKYAIETLEKEKVKREGDLAYLKKRKL